jgi:death on curing protein
VSFSSGRRSGVTNRHRRGPSRERIDVPWLPGASRALIHLTPAELPHGADHALDGPVSVRDYRLLEAALARPQASVAGQDAYPTLDHKAAAPLHSQARNHPLVDGNKRLALAGLIAFSGMNGRRLTPTNDNAHVLVMAVATNSPEQQSCANGRQIRRMPGEPPPHAPDGISLC